MIGRVCRRGGRSVNHVLTMSLPPDLHSAAKHKSMADSAAFSGSELLHLDTLTIPSASQTGSLEHSPKALAKPACLQSCWMAVHMTLVRTSAPDLRSNNSLQVLGISIVAVYPSCWIQDAWLMIYIETRNCLGACLIGM